MPGVVCDRGVEQVDMKLFLTLHVPGDVDTISIYRDALRTVMVVWYDTVRNYGTKTSLTFFVLFKIVRTFPL